MAYDLALGHTNRNWSIGEDDPWIWWSSTAKAEFDRIRNVLGTVNLEMSEAAKQGQLSSAEWKQWFGIYQAGHKLTSQSTWWSVSKGDIIMARKFEEEAKRWHDLVMSRGGKEIGPKGRFRKPSDSQWTFGWNLPTVGLAGGIVVAAGYLINAIRRK